MRKFVLWKENIRGLAIQKKAKKGLGDRHQLNVSQVDGAQSGGQWLPG